MPQRDARWLTHEYPAIAARAKREGAEIHWGDETSLRTSDPRGRGFAPRGQTPTLTVVAHRRSVSFLSTITNQGKVRFRVLPAPLSATLFIRFLGRLIRDTPRKVFVILDNLHVHKAARSQLRMLQRRPARVRRFFEHPRITYAA